MKPLARRINHLLVWLLVGFAAHAQTSGQTLPLEEAIALGVSLDPWLAGSRYRQQALSSEAVAAGSLPDPTVNLAAGSLPVDTFDINQEAMTQFKVGLSQVFPRGDTRALSRQQKEQLAQQEPLLRLDRKAQVAATVARLWLDVYRAQQTIHLIEKDRALFEYLVAAARSGYETALGRARQQDLIRAQLELIRLEDRLTALHLRREAAQRQLSEWVDGDADRPLPRALPSADTSIPFDGLLARSRNRQGDYELISHHPALQALDKRIEAMTTAVDLARQKYRPQWGLNAQYGYRDDDPMGRDRADLFSLGITFDLPLFPGNRQDRELRAALARAEALKTDKQLLARQLLAELDASAARLRRLNERNALYSKQLLPRMAEQADAALTAYNNDDGDFAEAVRARIAELDAKIEALSLAVDRQQLIARINYLLVEADTAQSESAP
ncbi:MAG: TolC family protein [Halioglobus sp.]|nr:TolC family protein [Halioglobus sp.]